LDSGGERGRTPTAIGSSSVLLSREGVRGSLTVPPIDVRGDSRLPDGTGLCILLAMSFQRLAVFGLVLLPAAPAAAQVSACNVNQRVNAGFMGSSSYFKNGTVIGVRPGECRVHFDEYSASYDDWVALAKVRPLDEKPPAGAPPAGQPPSPPPPPAQAEKPACRVGTMTLASALNYDAKILQHDARKGLYLIRYLKSGDEEWMPATGLKTCKGELPGPVPVSFFAGTWGLFTGGGGVWQKTNGVDWHVRALDAAKTPPLTLSADGRYTWVLDSKTTVRGKWRLAQQNELKDGYEKRGTAILLLNGENGKNWLVTRDLIGTSDASDRILVERADLGLTYRGGRLR
jgi:hypothetical protein